MSSHIELVTTGSELLSGRTANTHARTLGDAIAPLGMDLLRDTTVPDSLSGIEDAVRSALSRVDIVLVSGGLGPTSDDLTREAVAGIVGKGLVIDDEALRRIRERYERSKRVLTESVQRHALVVEGADVLQNAEGLAPGERISWKGKTIFLLPGPPREFQSVLTQSVIPWLTANAAATPPVTTIFQVTGIGESDIVTRLEGSGFPPPGVDVAYCARPGLVEVRISASREHASQVTGCAGLVRNRLGLHIFAEKRVTLEEVVGQLLRKRGETVAVAESCTGGLVGHRIATIPGSSDYFLGGVISYANASKERELGVKQDTLERHGAVSAETAREMAEGVRSRFGSTYGLSITGIAGPSGGTPEKPVGLVFVAVADAAGCEANERRFAGTRSAVQEWSSQIALDWLRLRILNQG